MVIREGVGSTRALTFLGHGRLFANGRAMRGEVRARVEPTPSHIGPLTSMERAHRHANQISDRFAIVSLCAMIVVLMSVIRLNRKTAVK